jgi:hypothetical protein
MAWAVLKEDKRSQFLFLQGIPDKAVRHIGLIGWDKIVLFEFACLISSQ